MVPNSIKFIRSGDRAPMQTIVRRLARSNEWLQSKNKNRRDKRTADEKWFIGLRYFVVNFPILFNCNLQRNWSMCIVSNV